MPAPDKPTSGNSPDQPSANRREFLTGKSLLKQVSAAGEAFADEILSSPECPPTRFQSGPTVRLGARAMACEFDVIFNAGTTGGLKVASEVLTLIEQLEDQMTVYRDHSELSQLNRHASSRPVTVEPRLFDLLNRARSLSGETGGAFDPTSGPLVSLWNRCRQELRLPTTSELEKTLSLIGAWHLRFSPEDSSLSFEQPDLTLNLGAIGKGYALDRAAELLHDAGLKDWLIHGGQSSILASGSHFAQPGWPVGIRNPQMPDRLIATLLLKNAGMGTSGSGTKFFRVNGKRYGHIIDPRTGWPAEGMLSVTVLAPEAATADALSTAFFVLGVEKSLEFCHNHPEIQAVLIPLPEPGRRLQPVVVGIPEENIDFPQEASPRFHSWD